MIAQFASTCYRYTVLKKDLSIYNLGVLEGLNTRAFWFALTLQCTQITNRVFLGKLAPDFRTNILMVQVQLLLSPSVL